MLHNYIQLHMKLDGIMEVQNMNSDQTVPLEAVLSAAILFAKKAT